jgi:hypothetical protein
MPSGMTYTTETYVSQDWFEGVGNGLVTLKFRHSDKHLVLLNLQEWVRQIEETYGKSEGW